MLVTEAAVKLHGAGNVDDGAVIRIDGWSLVHLFRDPMPSEDLQREWSARASAPRQVAEVDGRSPYPVNLGCNDCKLCVRSMR